MVRADLIKVRIRRKIDGEAEYTAVSHSRFLLGFWSSEAIQARRAVAESRKSLYRASHIARHSFLLDHHTLGPHWPLAAPLVYHSTIQAVRLPCVCWGCSF